MITIVNGTNRAGNLTSIFSLYTESLLKSKTNETVELINLEDLPRDFVFHNEVYGKPAPGFTNIVEHKIEPADKFIWISPEYNGGFPGVSKAFIDAVIPSRFKGKKIAFVGTSAGRSGNSRGMDQLTAVGHYLGMNVMPFKPAINNINALLTAGKLTDEKTIKLLDLFLNDFLEY